MIGGLIAAGLFGLSPPVAVTSTAPATAIPPNVNLLCQSQQKLVFIHTLSVSRSDLVFSKTANTNTKY
jgi:hypothetical protein